MSHTVARKPKAQAAKKPENSEKSRATQRSVVAEPGPFLSASPVFGLGAPAQAKLAIGQVNDPYEREAESVADRVTSGVAIAPQSISALGPGALRQAKSAEEKKPVQKAETKPSGEKKPESRPVQKAAKEPEKTPAKGVQKAAALKPEEKKSDKSVQKAQDKAGEKQPESKPVQKAEAKMADEKKPVQKAAVGEDKKAEPKKVQKAIDKPAEKPVEKMVQTGAGKAPEEKNPVQKADTKKDAEKKPIQKAETAKPEGKQPESEPVQKAETAKPEEKKPVQKAVPTGGDKEPEEKKPIQKADEKKPESTHVQRAAETDREDEAIQTEPAAAAPAPAPPMVGAAEQAIGQKGPGKPLATGTRSALESRMGTDFSSVRVHDDSAAQESARALSARAFTNQNDIWLGAGESQQDLHLMAHEATHVVQQSDTVQRQMIQRAWEPPGDTASAVDLDAKKVRVANLEIPAFKAGLGKEQGVEVSEVKARTNQIEEWKKNVKSQVQSALTTKLTNVPGIRRDTGSDSAVEDRTDDPNKIYFLAIGSTENVVLGNKEQLADELTIPRWGPGGKPRSLDVDHKEELQLGGDPSALTNLWLVDASANRSSGVRIANNLKRVIKDATEAQTGPDKHWAAPPTLASLVAEGFTVRFEKINPTGPVSGEPNETWTADKVTALAPWDKLTPLPIEKAKKLFGDKTNLVVFPASGGFPKKVGGWDAEAGTKTVGDKFLKGLRAASITYQPGKGSVTGKFGGKDIVEQDLSFPLTDVAGLPFTTSIDRGALRNSMRFAEFRKLSPIEFDDAGYDDARGLYAHGILRPSLPVFRGLEIDIWVDSEGVTLSKTITKDGFKIPGPVQITEANVTLSAGTSGLSADGALAFEIQRLGKGSVSARVGTSGGFELGGDFNFDSELFDPAKITIGYAEGKWSGSGQIGIPEGKVRGIRTASLTVKYDDGVITADGTVQPKIPGVQQAALNVRYSEAEGLVIGGTVQLAEARGIRSGSLQVTVTKTDRWKVSATGTAVPDVPGISSTLNISYDDGAFDANATAAYQRGLLSGSVQIGVTNRPVEDGKPAGEPGETLTPYGGGSLTLKIAPWLQATAGVRLLPNGEIEVVGEIGLPSSVEIFARREINKPLFNIATQVPIFPGIVAEIGGGLGATAGIGPGVIDQLKLGVQYNPSHEEDTTVTGDAHLKVPADAGLRLSVRAGIGLGITGASATGGLEIGGTLGIEGAAEAGVHVEWSPSKGLDLKADVSVHAQPSFTFDIGGYVAVTALGISVYDHKWNFASIKIGSDYRFGITLPIHYHEGEPFNVSLDDVQFDVPKIDTDQLLNSLIARTASQ